MHGKLQKSGLTEIIPLICTLALWGQGPVLSHLTSPQGAPSGVAAVAGGLISHHHGDKMAGIVSPSWVPLGLSSPSGQLECDGRNILIYWRSRQHFFFFTHTRKCLTSTIIARSVAQSGWTFFCNPKDCSPSGSSVRGIFPGKNTRAGFLLQGIFLIQGSNPCLLHCRQILYHLATKEVPYYWRGTNNTY